jgi:putative FmdB family regulatory protein
MPIYEYRCQKCGEVSAFLLKNYGGEPTSGCKQCQSNDLQRIMSAVAYHRSEADKFAQLDPKYGKMVDRALAKAPSDTDPDHYVRKMVPFSAAKDQGDPYFKE